MGSKRISKEQMATDWDSLRKWCPPGTTVYTVLRHVSASGMMRGIDVYVIVDNEPRWLSRPVSRVLGIPFDEKRECLRVGGCGMDMGFHVVYELSSHLYRAPDGGYSHDGAYSLKHRWL
jgi:hypothetical protein